MPTFCPSRVSSSMLCLCDKTSKSRSYRSIRALPVYIHLHAAQGRPCRDESLRHVSPCVTTFTYCVCSLCSLEEILQVLQKATTSDAARNLKCRWMYWRQNKLWHYNYSWHSRRLLIQHISSRHGATWASIWSCVPVQQYSILSLCFVGNIGLFSCE